MAPILPVIGTFAGRAIANIAVGIMISIFINKVHKKVNQAKTAWHKRWVRKKFDKSGLVVIITDKKD